MNEIDILKKAIFEYEKAIKLKSMNQELLEHLSGSIFYLLRYSKKHDLPIPNKTNLLEMINKANSLIEEITYQPKGNRKNYQPDSSQNHFEKDYATINGN